MLFLCGDMFIINKDDFDFSSLSMGIKDCSLPYCSNTYIIRKTLEYITYCNINKIKPFILLCWCDSNREEFYNNDLGYMTVSTTHPLIIYHKNYLKNKQYYMDGFEKYFKLNFIKKRLYDTLNIQAKEFVIKYRSNNIYNECIKMSYIVSLFNILENYEFDFLFVYDLVDCDYIYKYIRRHNTFLSLQYIIKEYETLILDKKRFMTYDCFFEYFKNKQQ